MFGNNALKAEDLQIVAAAVGPAFGVASFPPVKWSDLSDPQFEAVQTIIFDNRLASHVLKSAKLTETSLPYAFKQVLDSYQQHCFQSNSVSLRTARLVAGVLAEHGIQAAFFKGALSQHVLYGEYFIKHSTDIDLYVTFRDFKRARAILETIGFRLIDECRSSWWWFFLGEQHLLPPSPAHLAVDLHHRTQQPGCPGPREKDFFLKRATAHSIGSVTCYTLALKENILLAALSLAKAMVHRESSGKYAADLAKGFAKITELEAEQIVRIAKQQGLIQTLSLAARAVEVVFGAKFPIRLAEFTKTTGLISDEALARMVLHASDPTLVWPQRTQILMALCDSPLDFPREVIWKFSSEFWRVLTDYFVLQRPSKTSK
ncbi:MAG: hypothetical protein CFE32_05100 [Alphaproteobacteria bacterium PA3]|nr:MAG: hypothetical protein CFE32_05100 [Alphaproteobacteria bacterium PA3]